MAATSLCLVNLGVSTRLLNSVGQPSGVRPATNLAGVSKIQLARIIQVFSKLKGSGSRLNW